MDVRVRDGVKERTIRGENIGSILYKNVEIIMNYDRRNRESGSDSGAEIFKL